MDKISLTAAGKHEYEVKIYNFLSSLNFDNLLHDDKESILEGVALYFKVNLINGDDWCDPDYDRFIAEFQSKL